MVQLVLCANTSKSRKEEALQHLNAINMHALLLQRLS